MPSHSLLHGTLILLSASILNKTVGFIYQILVIRLIKPEGVGLFSMIFPAYIMMLVIASMGIPVAISKLVAEEVARNNLPGAYRIFKVSILIITVSSLILSFILLSVSPQLVEKLFPNPKVYLCFISLIPAILIVSLCSAFRGFFQGLQKMTPTAITQAAEQFVRVTAGLLFAWLLLPKGVEYAALGISIGVVSGELVGFIIMIYIYTKNRPKIFNASVSCQRRPPVPFGKIFRLGIPVTMTRLISTGLMSLDALIIPKSLLLSGLSLGMATSAYGQFVGITQALIYSPGVITIALSTVLVPAISEAQALSKNSLVKSRIRSSIKITLMMSFPLAGIFFVLPHDLSQILFGYRSAGDALLILALSCPFLYLQQTTMGILHGLGRADIPLKNLIQTSIFKVPSIYLLTSIPHFGIKGAAISLGCSYILMSLLNYRMLKKITDFIEKHPQYKQQDIISQALIEFAEKYH